MAELQRQEITARIREARKEAGLTLEEMALALDVTPRTYWNYEDSREDHGRVPWNLLGRIGEITGKSKAWLLHGDGETPDLMGSLNGDRDLAQIDKRLTHIEGCLQELVKWSQGGPTRKELESRINALADLAAETLGGQRRLHAQLLELSLDEEHPDRTAEEHSLEEDQQRAREAG